MKALIFVVVVGLLGWWGYRHGYIKPEWVGLGASPSASKSGDAGSLQDILNRGLPRMTGNDISLDRALANNQAVSYIYRFVDLDQHAVAQRYGSTMPAEMQAMLIRDLCSSRDLREQVLAKGREVQLQIRSQDGRTMFGAHLRPGGC